MNEERREQVNPYAVPATELGPERARVGANDAAYYAISARKLAVMSALTWGLYDFYFWWQQWRTRRQNGQRVSVFWRTTFSMYYALPFGTSVRVALIERGQPLHPMLGSAPLLYLLTQVVDNAVGWLVGAGTSLILSGMLSVVRAYTLSVLQASVNQVLAMDGYRGAVNRGVSTRTVLVGLVGLLLWLFALMSLFLPTWLP